MANNDMNIVLLLLVVLVSSISARVFLSIDCGSSDSSTDENTIDWSPDDAYIKTGASQVVSSLYSTSFAPINTLRVFKTRSNNCYSIPINNGERVLVRASFYYGNYDSKFLPPTFDLQLNGKFWNTIVNDLDITGSYYISEAILVVEGGEISACLLQTIDGQFPFISALELRSLDTSLYNQTDPTRALYMNERFIGSNSQTVRYPDDIYDRIWNPTVLTPIISSDALLTIDVQVKEKPPAAALEGALTSYLETVPISFQLITQLTTDKVPVYIIMYFVELSKLDATDKRSFDVYIDNKRLTSSPITPIYGIALEWTFTNISASSATVFSLKPTSDSTMPPILNAFEIYTFSGDSDTSSSNNNSSDNNNNSGTGSGSGDGDNSNSSNGGSNPKTKSKFSSGKKKSKTPTIVGSSVSVFICIWAVVGGVLIWHGKRKSAIATALQENGESPMPDGTPNSTHHILNMVNNANER